MLYQKHGDRAFASGTRKDCRITQEVLKSFFDKGLRNYRTIAKDLKVSDSAVLMATRKFFPEVAEEISRIKNAGDAEGISKLKAAIKLHGPNVPLSVIIDTAGLSSTTGHRLLDAHFSEWKQTRNRLPRRGEGVYKAA